MSGHSKWANIKRKKEVNDKARSNVFAKLARYITLAVVEGGGVTNPDHNVKLRLAVEKARQANMPKENITRSIEKGAGSDSAALKEIRYEAFGPGGSALIILAATDNQNRSFAAIRNVVERHSGKMGGPGSVSYLFEQCGMVIFPKTTNTEDAVLDFADRLKAIDIEEEEEETIVYVPFEDVGKLTTELQGLEVSNTEVVFKPNAYVEVSPEQSEQITNLIEALEEQEDVQNVFTNALITS
ncbi:YebC/PmpR family DNA-binding transcriptional regulator [Candidatus Roizmanbacteria bacterium]|nr:YebC/PmpR family DNA-binding transcriptional regulator [Candidatus Roizmanbacteria bacterium]